MIPFLLDPLGRIAGTILIAAIAWFGWLHNHDKKIVSRVTTEMKQVTNDTTQKIRAAADRSTNPSVRGKLDPTTRND